MRAICLWRSRFVLLLCVSCFMCRQAPAQAVDEGLPVVPNATPSATPQSAPEPELRRPAASVEAAAEEAPMRQLKFNLDFYAGVSNLPGQRRFRDGFWAGFGLGYPSVANLSWDSGQGSSALISLGLGDYKGQFITQDQPVEAWWKTRVGKNDLTIGKFWVPMALYEWEGETKWGVLMEREIGSYNVAASVNYNDILHNTNAYFRAGRSWGEKLTMGVSLAAGKGLSFGTVHDRGLGLDLTATWHGWQLTSEYVALQRRRSERFQFGFARLSYEKWGKLKPFISKHSWSDKAGEMGNFYSTTVGVDYQLTPELALQAAYADTSEQGVWWLQMHWMWEKVLQQRAIRTGAIPKPLP